MLSIFVFAAIIGLSGGAHALTLEELQPAVRDALKAHPFAKSGAPTPAFNWTLEKSRTLRKTQTVAESYAASTNGVASVNVSDQRGNDAPVVKNRVSLRGLEHFDADDATVDVTAQGVDMPPKSGVTFTITVKKDGESLTKSCKVAERSAASAVHAEVPGDMAAIACTGSGTYQGKRVKTKTQMAWFDALGVFLLLSEEAESGLLKFTETVKITKFSK